MKLLYWVIATLLISLSISFFPFQIMQTNELADNPQGCFYYITVQSILANSVLLSSDKANTKLIKQRLAKFENDLTVSTAPDDILSDYKNKYYSVLKRFGLQTINSVHNDNLIILLARNVYPVVDNYYLDERIFCINPLYSGNSVHMVHPSPVLSRTIIQFNLAGLYDHIPSRYSRILAAAPDQFQLGAFSGFFVNNQTTSLNIQLTTGIPMLTALYVLPGDDFANMGSYLAVVPWNSFSADYFINPATRKIMNIAGFDVFTVEKKDLGTRTIPDVVPLPGNINKVFPMGDELLTYVNPESYGMAYLANHVDYRNPKAIKPYEKKIKNDFAHAGRHADELTQATNALYADLRTLKEKRDILLESTEPQELSISDTGKPAGIVDIKGIVGERALFATNCQRKNCTFVFNIAKAPGWHVFVNGKSGTIERANFAFMATTVPEGNATVWFIYQPWVGLMSYLLSMCSLIGIFLYNGRNLKIVSQMRS